MKLNGLMMEINEYVILSIFFLTHEVKVDF